MAKTNGKSGASGTDNDRRGDNAATEPRDGNGRFAKARSRKLADVKIPEVTARNAALGALGAGIAVAAAAAGAALFKSLSERAGNEPGTDSGADSADVIDDDKRDAFAPATIPAPSRVEAMGSGE
jgi:hypothetical protein